MAKRHVHFHMTAKMRPYKKNVNTHDHTIVKSNTCNSIFVDLLYTPCIVGKSGKMRTLFLKNVMVVYEPITDI